jgi:tyrosine-protein kinase Etk/Wzc
MATETHYPDLKDAPGTRPGSALPPGDDHPSMLDLLIVLAERKRTVLGFAAVFAVVSILFSLLVPVRYTATAILMPPQQGSSVASALMSQLGSLGSIASLAGGGLGLKNPNDMYVGMLHSETVEDAMVRNFGLMQEYHKRYLSEARKKFESYALVEGDNKDGLIHISIEDHDPQRAADLANGYVDEFRRLSQGLAITEASQRRAFFEQQLIKTKDQLAGAEEALKQTEETTGLIQLDSQARALIAAAGELRAQIAAKEVQLQAMSTYATGQNSQIIETQQELDSLRAQLAKLGGSEDSADSLIVPRGKVPEAGLEYVRKLRDVKYYETMFEILARQLEIAKLDEAKEGALVQVVDPATRPDRRSFPKRTLIVLGGTIAGFFLGILLALVQGSLARMRANPEASAKLALLKNTLGNKNHPAV